jgi:E3 ubiquitin-protein ligase ZNF598
VDNDFVKVDENLGIKFEKDIILDDTILLLRYNCPDKDCDVQCLSWPDLHRHVKSKHGKVMCDLCTRNKKVFTHEHELFSFGELKRHERFGDDNPGAIDQSGFKGHPECGFCRQRFYSDDELYSHCREKHERCHICDRRNQGRRPQYYLNYQELEKHFAEAHFVCLDAECQANKTNVFESEMDLKAHQLSEHPNGLSKDARRDARLVDLSGFDIRTPYQPERRGGREHRGAGRGRDPNTDPLPVSSAQPIGRAELAYQRQMAIQSSQSVTNRTFGGTLTQPVPSSRPQSQPQPQPQQRPTPPTTALDTLTLTESSSTPQASTPQTPQEAARLIRHEAVISRATQLAHNSPSTLSQFRILVSSYRSSTLTAPALVERLAIDVFLNAPTAELGKLVRELADLYENESKRQGLLEAWNGYRSVTSDTGADDYPMLPVPVGGSSSTNSALPGGRRVLRLKSSTGPSSRSAVSRQGSWGNNALAISSSSGNATASNPFPPLSNNSKSKAAATHIAWSSTTSNTPNNSKQNPTPLSDRTAIPRPPPTIGPRSDEMFPSLPSSQKPSVLMAGLTRGRVRWNDQRSGTTTATVNAWSAAPTPAQAVAAGLAATNSSTNMTVTDATGDDIADGSALAKKKGKKGKGQVLYHFG